MYLKILLLSGVLGSGECNDDAMMCSANASSCALIDAKVINDESKLQLLLYP